MIYLLDSNVFIQAKNLHYGFDFCPAFWEWLIDANASKIVFSIEKVGDELTAGSDELAVWAEKRGAGFYLKPDTAVLQVLGKVSESVMNKNYSNAAINTFLQVADYYLIAQALAHNYVVVTHERAQDTRNTVKIPNVCIALGVKFMSPYEMLKHEQARFILGTKGS